MNKRMTTGEGAFRGRQVKQRRTFTLSRESVALLEELSRQRRSRGTESVSAVLDDLLLAMRRAKRLQEIEEQIGKYYDEPSDRERQDETEWGKFALAEFAAIVREIGQSNECSAASSQPGRNLVRSVSDRPSGKEHAPRYRRIRRGLQSPRFRRHPFSDNPFLPPC
jgi:hypothetical protein